MTSTTTLTVPAGLTGLVQTPFGNFPIHGTQVTVDSRSVVGLLRAGFSSADLPSLSLPPGMIALQSDGLDNGMLQTSEGNFTIGSNLVVVPTGLVPVLLDAGFSLPSGVPEQLAISDFENAVYSIAAVEKTFDEMWTAQFSSQDPGALVDPGVGWVAEFATGSYGSATLLASAELVSAVYVPAGCTGVISYEAVGEPLAGAESYGYAEIAVGIAEPGFASFAQLMQFAGAAELNVPSNWDHGTLIADRAGGSRSCLYEDGDATHQQPRKTSFTFSDNLMISVNGGAPVQQPIVNTRLDQITQVFLNMAFASNAVGRTKIKRVDFYPLVTDPILLQTLSV